MPAGVLNPTCCKWENLFPVSDKAKTTPRAKSENLFPAQNDTNKNKLLLMRKTELHAIEHQLDNLDF